MTDRLRLSWQNVKMGELWRYSNADPREYSNTVQTVPNSEIPDEHWGTPVSREVDAENDMEDVLVLLTQARTLRAWATADSGFTRNVEITFITLVESPYDLDGWEQQVREAGYDLQPVTGIPPIVPNAYPGRSGG